MSCLSPCFSHRRFLFALDTQLYPFHYCFSSQASCKNLASMVSRALRLSLLVSLLSLCLLYLTSVVWAPAARLSILVTLLCRRIRSSEIAASWLASGLVASSVVASIRIADSILATSFQASTLLPTKLQPCTILATIHYQLDLSVLLAPTLPHSDCTFPAPCI